jgi:predicted RNA-binding protein with TRAM domain
MLMGRNMENQVLSEGDICDMRIDAKNPHGEGIGKIRDIVVFIKNAKTRLGKTYKVKITAMNRTFAYAELLEESSKYFIGNGALII